MSHTTTENMLERLKNGNNFTFLQQIQLVFYLSLPAMLAQISSIIMEYIDASMVGHLGAAATASIGLVSTTTWLFFGITMAATTGFTVQVAQAIGAKEETKARNIMKLGLFFTLLYSIVMGIIGYSISGFLPAWLSKDTSLYADASSYFMIFVLAIPAFQMNSIAGGMLQASGDMKTPGFLNILCCIMDVVFNALLIFPSGTLEISIISLPGAGMGVTGAALGSVIAEIITATAMLSVLLFRSKSMKLRTNETLTIQKDQLVTAVKLALPVGIEQILVCGAYVCSTFIVAPLGRIAIAAHSLAITAESLCYMPGYGIGSAASTLIGQCVGAKRSILAKKLAWISTGMGITFMTCTGILLYIFAPEMMALLTPDPEIRKLGTAILRIEAFAEPLYAAAIVANGSFRGAGDTLVPSCMNFLSMWVIRLPLSWFLAYPMGLGLNGVWIAMCLELCARGLLFLIRLSGKRWMKKIHTISS